YSGDTMFNGSTSAVYNQVVNPAPTSTTLTSSVNPSVYGQSVTFTATVTAGAGLGTPTGTVTFKDGGTAIGSGTLDAMGHATFTTTTLTVGSHSITAMYLGNTNLAPSTSAPLIQIVGQASTTTSITSSPNPSVFGQAVLFTALVVPVAPGSGIRTG